MSKKARKQRPIELHIELRKGTGWDKLYGVVDSYVLVETRSGVTLHWAEANEWGKRCLEKEKEKIHDAGNVAV